MFVIFVSPLPVKLFFILVLGIIEHPQTPIISPIFGNFCMYNSVYLLYIYIQAIKVINLQ